MTGLEADFLALGIPPGKLFPSAVFEQPKPRFAVREHGRRRQPVRVTPTAMQLDITTPRHDQETLNLARNRA